MVIIMPRWPSCGTVFHLLDPRRDIVKVDHGDTPQTIRKGVAELGQPVVIDPEQDGQQLAVLNALVELQADGWIHQTHVYAVGIHVLDMLFRDIGAGSDILYLILKAQSVRVLEAQAGLGGGGRGLDFNALAIPPVAVLSRDHSRGAVAKFFIQPRRPQVERFKNMIVRRNDLVLLHTIPSYGKPCLMERTVMPALSVWRRNLVNRNRGILPIFALTRPFFGATGNLRH